MNEDKPCSGTQVTLRADLVTTPINGYFNVMPNYCYIENVMLHTEF